MRVSDIMVAPVVVVQKDRPLHQVVRLFEEKKIHAMPVLAMDGTIEGIISANDIVPDLDLNDNVETVMTKRTHVIGPKSRIQDAAQMMEKFSVHHLVVMDDGQVIGIVSS